MYCRVKRLCRDSMDTQYIMMRELWWQKISLKILKTVSLYSHAGPCMEEGSVLYGSMKCLHTEASQQPKNHRRKCFGHRFQSSARASCFALHWDCFLLPHTMQHWLLLWSLPELVATCLAALAVTRFKWVNLEFDPSGYGPAMYHSSIRVFHDQDS